MPNIELKITFETETRSVRVEGAIQDKLLAFGLLETAKESIVDFHKQQQQRVQIAPAIPGLKLD
jgi:ABC-type lipoprotein export system ATPase subunit